MQRRTTVVLLLVCLTSIVAAQAPAPAEPAATSAQPPSAEKTTSTEAPWDKFTTFSALMTGGLATADEIHIYRHGNLMRMEGSDGHSYVIQDLRKAGDARMISRANCLQLKYPFVRSFPIALSWSPNKYETVILGKETIDGHPTQVQQVTITFGPEAKHPTPLILKIWTADDLQGFPVKIETKMHRTIEFRKVDFGEQDPTLFIVPGECAPLEAAKGNVPLPAGPKAPAKAPAKEPH